MKKLLFISTAFLVLSCGDSGKRSSDKKSNSKKTKEISEALEFAHRIEDVHQKKTFSEKKAVQFDIRLHVEQEVKMAATITLSSNSPKIRIDKKNGGSLIYNGKNVFISPKNANFPQPISTISSWPYLFAIPFKLTDPGTHWEKYVPQGPNEKNYRTAKMRLDARMLSENKWYVLYTDPQTNLLKAAAFENSMRIFGENKGKKPQAVVYQDYISVKNIPISTTWKFFPWSEEKGIYGEPVGTAQISNIRFLLSSGNLFEVPKNAKLIERSRETPIL